MAILSNEFIYKTIPVKKKLFNQNTRPRSCSHGKQKRSAGAQQPTQKGQDSGDDDDGEEGDKDGLDPYCREFNNDAGHDKITLPNAVSNDPAPRKCSLKIKSPLEINLSSDTPKPLLTVADLASLLGISRPTVYRLVEDRKIPFLKLGSLIRFTKANIEQFLNDRQINPIL